MFVLEGERQDTFQITIDEQTVSDHYFDTFRLFRSAREAISFIPDREDVRKFQLWYFKLIWPRVPPDDLFKKFIDAMSGEAVAPPDFPLQKLGYEILDQDTVSVTHNYYDIAGFPEVNLKNLSETADLLASRGFWLMEIERVVHPWWLPEQP